MTDPITKNKETLRNYIFENTFKEANLIKDDTLLFQEGFFDSMGFVMLVDFLEEKLALKISDEDLTEENFESINAISSFIARNLGGK